MYLLLTGSIYAGGAGSIIVGGLYWKRGSILGAWSAMIAGGTVALSGLIFRCIWPSLYPTLVAWFSHWHWLQKYPSQFPLNGMHVAVIAMVCAIIAYITGSLVSWWWLKCPAFDMERMLHRGKYAIKDEHLGGVSLPQTGLKALLPSKEFSFGDKCFYYANIAWTVLWFGLFVVVTIYHFLFGTTDWWWCGYWRFYIYLNAVIGIVALFWFLVGGLRNIREMFQILRTKKVDVNDNGRVVQPSTTSVACESVSVQ